MRRGARRSRRTVAVRLPPRPVALRRSRGPALTRACARGNDVDSLDHPGEQGDSVLDFVPTQVLRGNHKEDHAYLSLFLSFFLSLTRDSYSGRPAPPPPTTTAVAALAAGIQPVTIRIELMTELRFVSSSKHPHILEPGRPLMRQRPRSPVKFKPSLQLFIATRDRHRPRCSMRR